MTGDIQGVLAGRRALVTGASKGIGRAICNALVAEGALVTGIARASNELGSLSAELGPSFDPWLYDVTGEDVLARIDAAPAFDLLVNNAGTNRPQPFAEVTDEALDLMLDLNVRSAFRIARAAARRMERGASIIHMTSQMGHVGSPNRTVYCMTKHALEGLSKAMAVELAPVGIRVNCISPGFFPADQHKNLLYNADGSLAPRGQQIISHTPVARFGYAHELAGPTVFLASASASSFVTGHNLVVDGGFSATTI
jgi:NAD(P)-dependent dehydrogenase (short-subunit alcohol dehydrogenase family)